MLLHFRWRRLVPWTAYISSGQPYEVLLLSTFCRWGMQGPERLSKLTLLGNARAGIWTHVCAHNLVMSTHACTNTPAGTCVSRSTGQEARINPSRTSACLKPKSPSRALLWLMSKWAPQLGGFGITERCLGRRGLGWVPFGTLTQHRLTWSWLSPEVVNIEASQLQQKQKQKNLWSHALPFLEGLTASLDLSL